MFGLSKVGVGQPSWQGACADHQILKLLLISESSQQPSLDTCSHTIFVIICRFALTDIVTLVYFIRKGLLNFWTIHKINLIIVYRYKKLLLAHQN